MRLAILQSNYIPWKGYFDLINKVELFIFHDDLQYTKNDWRNRNYIKTQGGKKWLSIPCGTSEDRLICEVAINDPKWQRDHWNQIMNSYSKAPYFKDHKDFFQDIYLNKKWNNLSELNQFLIQHISSEFLGIKTRFEDSRRYDLQFKKAERVVELVTKAGGTTYLSGPSAQNYLKQEDFAGTGVTLEWMDYSGYPEYPQFFPPFDHYVTVLDLLFHTGTEATKYMISFK